VAILSSSAKQKVTTGMELPAAAATVADVNLRLTWYRLKLSVFPTKAHKKSLSSHATGIDHAFFLWRRRARGSMRMEPAA
jgi:hypothetical protein